MSISVLGAGAFGTALAIAISRETDVVLWGRDAEHVAEMQASRQNAKRLPDALLPTQLTVTDDLNVACRNDVILLAVPMQKLAGFVQSHRQILSSKALVACCKGVDQSSGLGPVETIAKHVPDAKSAILTGPSFAADIAKGLPTALTLACADEDVGEALQQAISTPALRLYRTTDTTGAALGGAFKNVIAIACGVAMGAGLGESARAALMTRGFAEMTRLAQSRGGLPATLVGLSGFGDLTLTCTSNQSRNYQLGLALGAGQEFDDRIMVEGAATARALRDVAIAQNIDLPITVTIAAILDKTLDVRAAMAALLSRPLKEE
ncbi:MAG: NAD(P)-dependent glycerol-3-phosphate dehydrogenase [Ascidiaceihabitans sp.]|nr:NAD(P)-dependent glycerol-3-phosphate dehydrogenase [Ascidiaceihabitans sp.]